MVSCGPRFAPMSGARTRAFAVEQPGHRGTAVLVQRAELRERHRVKGAGGQPVAHAEATEPGAQLAGGLAGEREREHVTRFDGFGGGMPRDPPGEHAGLAGAGRGQDRQGARWFDDRASL